VLLLAAYLLVAPPVFVLGPLAALLLFSRPASTREWGWVIGLLLWSAVWLEQTGGMSAQWVRAAAVLVTGAFVALTLWRPSNTITRAMTATGLAGLALAAWMRSLGIDWEEVRRGVEIDLGEYRRALLAELTGAGAPREVFAQASTMIDTVALLYPALIALAAIGGLRLAWVWYHRIAARPVGPTPKPFKAFAFSDQLVWGGVVGLALCLLAPGEMGRAVGANRQLVLAVLYATRGLAIFSASSIRVPPPVLAAVTLASMFLLPFVLGGLTLLGLADTWLDFRRRLTTPATGG
jgi:hypothetical protein